MSAKKNPDQIKVKANTPPVQEAVHSNNTITDFFDTLGNKAVFLALGLILLTGIYIFKDYLFFEKAYYFSDMGSDSENYLYPNLYNSADYIAKHGIPKWSFNFGMGQNIFPFFLRDPFDIFIYIAGKDHIHFATIYKEFFKIIAGGIVFFYYLKELKCSNFTAIIGSLLYSFCGFNVLGSGWQIFTFETFNMALLLLAFERLFQKGKWYLFPIAIFLVSMSQPFNLYVYGLFLIAYAILRHVQTGTLTIKNITPLFLKMAGLGLIGILVSAPFLLEIIVQIIESPRGSGANSYAELLKKTPMFYQAPSLELGTSVMRFFSNDIIGNGTAFKGWTNYLEAPLFYCGIPCLVLMPQVFGLLEKRARIGFIIFLAIWLTPMFFPYFRRAFWLFSGDYYRAYSFFVAFFFLYYSLLAIDLAAKARKMNIIVLIVTVVVLFGLLHYSFFDDDIVVTPIATFVTVLMVVYGALFYFMNRRGAPVYLRYVFLFTLVVELCYLSSITVNDRKAVMAADVDPANKREYNDYTKDALKLIGQNDKSFYRIDKTYASSLAMHFSINDGMAQGYRGTCGYSPFNQQHYISYLQLMGVSNKAVEIESRWALGLTTRPILEAENRVKYLLAKTQVNPLWAVICDQVGTVGDVKIFRSKFVLPLGFTYDHVLKQSDFENLSIVQKDFTTLKTCILKDEDMGKATGLTPFNLKDTIPPNGFNMAVYGQCVSDMSRDTLTISQFDETLLAGHINATGDKMMYLTIPCDNGWTLKVDGQITEKILLDGGMTGVMLRRGGHDIEMKYELRYMWKGLWLALLGIGLYAGVLVYFKRKSGTTAA